MTVSTWGTLEKSAVDPQVITAAIQEMIDAHEANPSAHLGPGESLEQHKKNEILDHPKASVVADKVGASDIVYTFSFETIENFPDSLRLFLDYANEPYLYLEYNVSNNAYVEFTAGMVTNFYNENKIITLSFNGRIETNATNLTGYFGWYNLRFSIIAGVLKARFYRGVAYNEVNLSGIDISAFHFYKIIYIPTDNIAYFYIDGVVVASITRPAGTPIVAGQHPIFTFTINGGTEHIIRFSNLVFTRSL